MIVMMQISVDWYFAGILPIDDKIYGCISVVVFLFVVLHKQQRIREVNRLNRRVFFIKSDAISGVSVF